ncbi:MAG: DUF4215 domain-containing protein [Deltaproteobacteria bacterium]|nr:DUF4215 domain-containing protein [Deltaproteobacteria bacterium]
MKLTVRSLIFVVGLTAPAAGFFAPATAIAAPAEPQRCEITFHVAGSATLGAFEAHVDYSASSGDFEGAAGAVSCVATVPGAFAFAVDNDAGQELGLGMISVVGVELPQDFWRCTFLTDTTPPLPADFAITVDEALDSDFVAAAVTASVSQVTCASDAQCGNGVVESDEECDDGAETLTCSSQCTLTAGTQRCLIGFHVAGNGVLGSLQFNVGYADAGGDFEGTGEAVACTPTIESTLTASNDRDPQRELRLGLVSPSGLTLPIDLWQCDFLTTTFPPVPDDFLIAGVEATDLSLTAIPVDVTLGNLGCIGIPPPQCGNGRVEEQEACDDGNTVNTDACTNTCRVAICGDGIVQPGLGETCDDGNTLDTDLCTSLCKTVGCGDVSRDGKLLAGDALQILKQAVGLETRCVDALCVCDTNGDAGVKASDALLALKAAVGQSVELNCSC